MPTTFCALDEAYGNWGKEIRKQNVDIVQKETIENNTTTSNDQKTSLKDLNVYSDNRSFCPNCQNCIDANNIFQQKVIEQNIWPRPRWTPQIPTAYDSFDPYNRYWMNTNNVQEKEEFSNINNNSSQGLLQLILFVLVALFIIQFIEMIYKMTI